MMPERVASSTGHRVEVVSGRIDAELSERLVAFWVGHRALDERGARERLDQVVCVLLDPDGEIAGANSAYPAIAPLVGRRFWIYRRFLAAGAGDESEAATRSSARSRAMGGPTETHRPADTSPALDAGIANGLATDQRGEPRTVDRASVPNAAGSDATDMGSVELGPGAPPVAPPVTPAERCLGEDAEVQTGTDGPDTLAGTPGADVIRALGGDDLVSGRAGRDCLLGQQDADEVRGGASKDLVKGNAGEDLVKGNGGNDDVRGGADDDRVVGNHGKDVVRGGSGGDRLRGGQGRDRVIGGGGGDEMRGDEARDRLIGKGGDDRIRGGPARDRIRAGGGDDRINTIDNNKRDAVNCGAGDDRVVADERDEIADNCEQVIIAD